MIKLSTENITKYAHYAGQYDAYLTVGVPEENIKLAFLLGGLSLEEFDFVKEAFYGRAAAWGAKALGGAKGLLSGAKGLLSSGGGALRRSVGNAPGVVSKGTKFTQVAPSAATRGAGKGILKGTAQGPQSQAIGKMVSPGAGRASNWAGRQVQRSGQAVGKGMQNFATKPWQTTKGFGKNFAQGAMFNPQARGIGGTVGRGVGATSLAGMLLPGGQPRTPTQQQQQTGQYGRY